MARRPDKNSFFWLTQREITSNIRVKRKLNICVEEGTLTRMSPSVIEDADSQVLSLSFSSDGESLVFAAYVNGKISEVNMKDDNHYDINLPENYWPWILQLHPSIPRVLAYATRGGNVCIFTIDDDVSDVKSCALDYMIESLSFHAEKEVLIFASSAKLFYWPYRARRASRTLIWKARSPIRSVQFHPLGAPYLLTAEDSDIKSPGATSIILAFRGPGYDVWAGDDILVTLYDSGLKVKINNDMSILGYFKIIPKAYSIYWSNSNNRHPLGDDFRKELKNSSDPGVTMEAPSLVTLKLWNFNIERIGRLNDVDCLLAIKKVILCCEKGAHISPCGRLLAACVAKVRRPAEGMKDFISNVEEHGVIVNRITYRLCIFSLERSTLGFKLKSKKINGARGLTSIQFSPTSEYVLVAYGRRHSSMIHEVDDQGVPTLYNILQIYRVSDMQLINRLVSKDDVINVACFNPSVGGGFVCGTMTGCIHKC